MRALLVLSIFSTFFAGCGSDEAPRDMLIYARGADSQRLDPIAVDDGESVKVINQIYDTLIRFDDRTIEMKPGLATAWKQVSGEPPVWEFTLRKGVKFHDGKPMDADAVAESFKRATDLDFLGRAGIEHKTKTFFFIKENGKDVPLYRCEAVKGDARRVRFTLRRKSGLFLTYLASYPSSVVSPAARKAGKKFAQRPVGTGPYRFRSWKDDDVIVLDRNDGYWRGKPAFRQVRFLVVPDNKNRLLRLERGEVDIIDGVQPQDRSVVKNNPDLKLAEGTPLTFVYLAMNTTHPPFNDARVRRAVAYALDRSRLLPLYDGAAKVAVSTLPPGLSEQHNNDLKPYTRDVKKAKALLSEAGHKDGVKATLYYMANPRPYLDKPSDVAQTIQSQLADAGIILELKQFKWAQYLPKVQSGEHDLCLLGWTADYPDADNFLYVHFSKENAVKGSAQNVSFFDNAEVNRLLSDARFEMDAGKRAKMYKRVQAIVHEEVPVVPLVYPTQRLAYRKGMRGVWVHPIGNIRLFPVKKG